jgi:hypothetical protein
MATIPGIETNVMMSAAMFRLMCDNQRKMEAKNEQSKQLLSRKSAEEMSGHGDLPPNPEGYISVNQNPPASSVPIEAMLPVVKQASPETSAPADRKRTHADEPAWDRKKMVPMWPGKPWYYIASHPSDSESE